MPADVVQAGLRQPTMWITRDADTMRLERRCAGGWAEAAIHETLTTMRAVFERLPGAGYYVQVPGMFHADMTDVPLLSPLASRLGLSGPIGAQRAHRIINAYSLAFFDRHLKDRPAVLLDGPAAASSTSSPGDSPNHHQPDKPALCRGPGVRVDLDASLSGCV